jgi:hypothetical protein
VFISRGFGLTPERIPKVILGVRTPSSRQVFKEHKKQIRCISKIKEGIYLKKITVTTSDKMSVDSGHSAKG